MISNALSPSDVLTWELPTNSAFTDEEIRTVNRWVKDGGLLLLIADHRPLPGCARKLAASFGFDFENGFALKPGNEGAPNIFSRPAGSLRDCAVSHGRDASERIDSVRSFTGQAFGIPDDAVPIMVLDDR